MTIFSIACPGGSFFFSELEKPFKRGRISIELEKRRDYMTKRQYKLLSMFEKMRISEALWGECRSLFLKKIISHRIAWHVRIIHFTSPEPHFVVA